MPCRGRRSVPLLLMAFLGYIDLAADVPATAPLLDPIAAVIAAAVLAAVCDLAGIHETERQSRHPTAET